MRDPCRIDPTLQALNRAWTLYPDMRLIQLLTAAAKIADPVSAPFFVEDEVLLAGLERLTTQR